MSQSSHQFPPAFLSVRVMDASAWAAFVKRRGQWLVDRVTGWKPDSIDTQGQRIGSDCAGMDTCIMALKNMRVSCTAVLLGNVF